MAFRMKKVTDRMHRVHQGHEAIGWVRYVDNVWLGTVGETQVRGVSPSEAFTLLTRALNDATARAAGFADTRAMVEARNAEVIQHVEEFNREMAELGVPARKRVVVGRRFRV